MLMLEAHRSSAFLGPLKLLTRESRRTVSLQSPIKKWWLRLLHKGCTYNTMIEVYTVEKTRSPGWSTEIPSLPKIEGGEMRGGGGADLADVALGHGRRVVIVQEGHPLVLPGGLVGGVHLLVAGGAERGLVRAAQHPRLRGPARVALDLHPSLPAAAGEILGRGRAGAAYVRRLDRAR
jgi:hypothetical protein